MAERAPHAPLPAWPDGGADQLERELLHRWEREGLFDRVQQATASGAPWVFYEGPPTANGRPGIHHVFARTIKDMVCRYHVMQGQRVTRIAGWDTHGLPVELEVEKQLGMKGKQDIEAFGVAEFNRRCLESVFTYRDEWVELSNRIGYWLDYDRAYITCTRDYIESVWWLLRELHQRDLLYRGHRVLPYCPRCGTTLSSHELALGYEELRDRSVYATAPLTDGSGRELVIWTTTPWTLPSNVAIAVHPELEYGTFVLPDGRRLIAATSRASVVAEFGAADEPEARFPGRELLGLHYRRPLEIVDMPDDRDHAVVVAGDFVTATDGSGLVHLAPFGTDDYTVIRANNLALPMVVAADGTFRGTRSPELEGKLVTAAETNETIIRALKANGRHLKTEQHVHSYPHCWRCRSKLIYYPRTSWFVRTSAYKERMLELNADIAWHPADVGTGRFGEWLGNNVDWALSRERYWGTPLPVWVNDQDPAQIEVIGSYAELRERSGFSPEHDLDVHRPWIDDVTWTAPDGGTMRRVPEVIDTWFDSGSMPYAQWHYPFEHRDEFASHFPADYICEGVDQTRGWFYSLLAIGTAVMDAAPYRNVIVNELILDAQGQKMSKSRGNVVNPWDLIAEHGADAARLYLLLSSQVWMPKRFDVQQLRETAGALLNTLRNTYQFFALYAGDRATAPHPVDDRPLADRWILGALDGAVAAVRQAFDGYDVTSAARAVADFVDADLSNWYVRLNRHRFWAPDRDADPDAVATLEECLVTVARLLAPAAPFASDWLHRALTGESVHLASFPGDRGRSRDLDPAMRATRTLVSLARAARESAKLPVRQPLQEMRIADANLIAASSHADELVALVRREANVKSITFVAGSGDLVRHRTTANFRTLGKVWGSRMPEVAAAVGSLAPADAERLAAGGSHHLTLADGTPLLLTPADVIVKSEVMSDWPTASQGMLAAALDPVVTEALAREGMARELVNRIQRLRKEAGYQVSTRVVVAIDGDAAVTGAVAQYGEYIAGETLAKELRIGVLDDAERNEAVTIGTSAATIALRRIGEGRTLSGPGHVGPG